MNSLCPIAWNPALAAAYSRCFVASAQGLIAGIPQRSTENGTTSFGKERLSASNVNAFVEGAVSYHNRYGTRLNDEMEGRSGAVVGDDVELTAKIDSLGVRVTDRGQFAESSVRQEIGMKGARWFLRAHLAPVIEEAPRIRHLAPPEYRISFPEKGIGLLYGWTGLSMDVSLLNVGSMIFERMGTPKGLFEILDQTNSQLAYSMVGNSGPSSRRLSVFAAEGPELRRMSIFIRPPTFEEAELIGPELEIWNLAAG